MVDTGGAEGPGGAIGAEETSPGSQVRGKPAGAKGGLPGANLDGEELQGAGDGKPQEPVVGDTAGLRKPESQGQRQENNCEDAEVGNIAGILCELKEGAGGEPGARTSRLGSQAGCADRQAPPGCRDVPVQPTQRAEHLKGRKGTPEGGRGGSPCQTLEEKRLDQATGVVEVALVHGEGVQGPDLLAVSGKGGLSPGPGEGTFPSEGPAAPSVPQKGIQQGKVGRPA